MSKASSGNGDLTISSFPSSLRGNSFNHKSTHINPPRSTNNNTQVAQTQQQKLPRNTHRHHRKPEASLSHLLNFSYERPSVSSNTTYVRRGTRVTPSFGRGSGHHPLDKAHFVNANYRFVVNPSGEYKANLAQSDIPVPWENVLQVLASVQSQCNACPICLEDVPVAPRMSKCGHVFCLPCALKYLDSADLQTGKTTSKWRKCPICFDSVYAHELRPVKWFSGDDMLPTTGNEVTLQLIMRMAGSMFALPRETTVLADDAVPWYNQPDALEYARIVKGDSTYMTAESEREIVDMITLREQDAEAFGDEDKWTSTAIQNIEDRSPLFSALGTAPRPKLTSKQVKRAPIVYTPASDIPGSSTALDMHQNATTEGDSSAYYFYQPRTGSHYYLAPLDIRILKKAFGAFLHFPSALIARLEHAYTVTLDEDLRRRSKYLSHLPLGCEVTFLECDWSSVLSAEVLSSFKVDIDRRRKRRHDKAVTEETARRRAQAAEEKKERAGLGDMQWYDDDTSYFARNDESNTYEVFADDHPAGASVSSDSMLSGSLERRSIWGTALPAAQEPVKASDDDVWKDQLEKFYQDSAVEASLQDGASSQGKKGKTKKKKLVLMSSGGGRGTG